IFAQANVIEYIPAQLGTAEAERRIAKSSSEGCRTTPNKCVETRKRERPSRIVELVALIVSRFEQQACAYRMFSFDEVDVVGKLEHSRSTPSTLLRPALIK